MKKCKDFCDQFSDYLDGELGDNACRLMEEHLAECSPCAVLFKSLRTAVEVCSQGIPQDMPEDVRNRLKAFLKQRCRSDHA